MRRTKTERKVQTEEKAFELVEKTVDETLETNKTYSRRKMLSVAEKAGRAKYVLDLIRQGYNYTDCIDLIQTEFNTGMKNAVVIYTSALDMLCKQACKNPEEIREKQNLKLDYIFKTCMEKKDMKNALAALDIYNKLNNLYGRERESLAQVISFKFGNAELRAAVLDPNTTEVEAEEIIGEE